MSDEQTATVNSAAQAGVRMGVRCRFDCSRSVRAWSVRHALVREGLSRPYRIELALVTPEIDTDPDELVGASCEFAFDRVSQARSFFGIVRRAQARGVIEIRGAAPLLRVGVEIVPALALLSQRITCRIFQDMTVPEIVRDVLLGAQAPAGAPEGLTALQRTVVLDALSPTSYQPPRDYCVQYRESDLDFVARLLHDEGIVYLFDHEAGEHEVLRLVDDESALPSLSTPAGVRLPIDAQNEQRDAIVALEVERAVTSGRAEVQHEDWMIPPRPVRQAGEVATAGSVRASDREVFVPSDGRVREIYDGARVLGLHDDADRRLALVLERLAGDEFVARGSSTACMLGAGVVFEIDHAAAFDRMVALEVVHEITIDGDTLDVRGHYGNTFVAVPSSRFRATGEAPPRPRMHGPQTATVTGPAGEDIHTDAWGRIKILMHWDREGEGRGRARREDEGSSVWVRVLQSWGGAGWGTLFLPRVGMEVLVEFIDGNPDRPVVTGCLYNGRNPPPYPLPEERTRTTIRTQSTPGTGGFNELRFDDAADLEEIYIRAQRDMNELVQRNHTTDVRVDQSHTVGANRSREVGGNERIRISGSRDLVVEGRGAGPFSGESIKVTNDYKLDVAKTILVQAPVDIVIRCEGSTIHMTPERITLQAGGGAKLVLDRNGLIQSNDGSRGLWDADVTVESSKGARGRLDADVRITAKDAAEVLLTKDAKISSGGAGHALFEDKRITVDSGEATITIDSKNVEVLGDAIDAKADTKLSLEGGGARNSLQGGRAAVN